jgi:hypothetical protein
VRATSVRVRVAEARVRERLNRGESEGERAVVHVHTQITTGSAFWMVVHDELIQRAVIQVGLFVTISHKAAVCMSCRHIFGHSSSQYKSGWSRLGKLQVQWDTSSWGDTAGSSSSSEAEQEQGP